MSVWCTDRKWQMNCSFGVEWTDADGFTLLFEKCHILDRRNCWLVIVNCDSVAGYSVAHFLVNIPHEARTTAALPTNKSGQKDKDQCATGLQTVLSHLHLVTDANLLDSRGRTPLMCAIIDGQKAAAQQLVCFRCSFSSLVTEVCHLRC